MIAYIISGLAITALIIITVYHISYRRQVEELSRQVQFINENKTEMKMVADISSKEMQKLTEEINKLKARLEETESDYKKQDEALRETITNISHDIRTPLTSLDGYIQFLEEKDIPEEKRTYYLDIIKNRVKSLNDMLNELFTYAKMQDRNYTVELTEIDMAALTADTMMLFYDDIAKNGTEPEIVIPDECVPVKGNREALIRVIQNIIKNALMHGKNLKVRLEREKETVRFTCSDELLNKSAVIDVTRVFDRFYKGDPSRGSGGSGLGLAISRELVEKMGGTIEAKCEDGIFSIIIGLCPGDQ